MKGNTIQDSFGILMHTEEKLYNGKEDDMGRDSNSLLDGG